jgi:crotonobetainyl-CoA:carnitine CoA-transferase CaiB-like acyl-CoA transferase
MPANPDSAAATGPLAGIRVIDLTINVLGPVCTQILGDMGADVIKIEAPEGDYIRYVGPGRSDGMSVFFLNLNRNKRSVVLDLKQPGARAALMKLIETADVFVHSMRPGAADRLGLGYDAVSGANPRIIYASAAGYRQDSSRRDWPAFDDVIQGVSGIAAMNARVTGEPRYFPTVICDKFCGYVLASSIGMALFARERTSKGQQVHVAMMDTMVGFNMLEHLWGGVIDEPSLGIGYSRMLTPHRRPYRTSDGHISVLAVTNEQWRRLFVAMDRPDLLGDGRFADIGPRAENIDVLYGLVVEGMKCQTTQEWRRRLDAADVPNGEVNDLEDLLRDPYLQETGFFQKMQHPTEGAFVAMSIPVEFSQTRPSIRSLPPRLGEHTDVVLAELGLSRAEIDGMAARRLAAIS